MDALLQRLAQRQQESYEDALKRTHTLIDAKADSVKAQLLRYVIYRVD